MKNSGTFKVDWEKIEDILLEINLVSKVDGHSYDELNIDENGITYYSGPEQNSFTVKWEEINNPLPYFKEKYEKEILSNSN